jgi:tetratricopeptide (TPR) repeat protein
LTRRLIWRRYVLLNKLFSLLKTGDVMKSIFTIPAIVCLALGLMSCGGKNEQPATNANSSNMGATADGSNGESIPRELTPEQIEARKFLEQGNELARKDEDQAAADIYQKAISLDPDFPDAHLRLAMSLEVLGKKDEAEEEYKKAAEAYQKYVRHNQKDARAHFNMGLAYNRLGKPEESVKAFRQAVKLEPENSDNQYELGIAYGKTRLYQESVNALQKSLEIDPDNYRAQEALETAKINLQRWQAMVKQQEAIAKRQGAKNANGANANTSANLSPTPETP